MNRRNGRGSIGPVHAVRRLACDHALPSLYFVERRASNSSSRPSAAVSPLSSSKATRSARTSCQLIRTAMPPMKQKRHSRSSQNLWISCAASSSRSGASTGMPEGKKALQFDEAGAFSPARGRQATCLQVAACRMRLAVIPPASARRALRVAALRAGARSRATSRQTPSAALPKVSKTPCIE